MKLVPTLNTNKNWRKELWEIQGLLWIITAKHLENNIAEHLFFWYGVSVIVFAMTRLATKPTTKDNT